MIGKLVSNFCGPCQGGTVGGIAYFELQCRPDIPLVTLVRRFVVELYRRFLSDPEGTSRIALATHELLENAARYSKDGETTIRIEVDLDREPRQVTIAMSNRAEPVDIAALREVLDGVASAPDAFEFYQRLLVKRARTRKGGSGLGLARICAEGQMKVTYRLLDIDVTVIEATAQLGGGGSVAP